MKLEISFPRTFRRLLTLKVTVESIMVTTVTGKDSWVQDYLTRGSSSVVHYLTLHPSIAGSTTVEVSLICESSLSTNLLSVKF